MEVIIENVYVDITIPELHLNDECGHKIDDKVCDAMASVFDSAVKRQREALN